MPEADVATERKFLLCMFFQAGMFSYCQLLCYPLYKSLAAAKGQEEVDSTLAGIILMCSKMLVLIILHQLGHRWTTLRELQLQIGGTYLLVIAAMVTAAHESVSEVPTLLLMTSMNLVAANITAATCFTTPSEERCKARTLFYYAASPAGCLWTSLVSFCLNHKDFQASWALRATAMVLPMLVGLASWMLLPADGFWSPERMLAKQLELEQEMEKAMQEDLQALEDFKTAPMPIEEGEEEEKKEQRVSVDELFPNLPRISTAARTHRSRFSQAVTVGAPPPVLVTPPVPLEGPARLSRLSVARESLSRLNAARASARASRLEPCHSPRRDPGNSPGSGNSPASSNSRSPRNERAKPSVRASARPSGLRGSARGSRFSSLEAFDRSTLMTRMSFFTPLNTALGKDVAFVAANLQTERLSMAIRASVHPDLVEEVEVKVWYQNYLNPVFRVLLVSQCLVVYSYSFYSYTIFPELISHAGPNLDMVSLLYSAEGGVQVVVSILLMSFLDTHIFAKFFGTALLLSACSPLAITLLGKLHWILYIVTVLLADLTICCHVSLLSVVLLRSLAWGQILTFYTDANLIGGVLSAVANLQMPLKTLLGSWELTVMIGHGVPALLVLIFFLLHLPTMRKLKQILKKPVRRSVEGEWDPEDLEEMLEEPKDSSREPQDLPPELKDARVASKESSPTPPSLLKYEVNVEKPKAEEAARAAWLE